MATTIFLLLYWDHRVQCLPPRVRTTLAALRRCTALSTITLLARFAALTALASATASRLRSITATASSMRAIQASLFACLSARLTARLG